MRRAELLVVADGPRREHDGGRGAEERAAHEPLAPARRAEPIASANRRQDGEAVDARELQEPEGGAGAGIQRRPSRSAQNSVSVVRNVASDSESP